MNDKPDDKRPDGLDDAGPVYVAMMATAAGTDLLLAEMRALSALLPGHARGRAGEEVPGEPGFDDLPV